jgi:SAM-dependent methyltransferase
MTTLELHGIYHELAFWQQFVKTDRFLKGWVGKVKTPELNQEVADFIKSVPHDTVLDVGSGVCSILNGLVNVTPCDPLGHLYKLIFDFERHKLKAPLPYPAEELPFKNEFDIVHISNALDHTQETRKALDLLLQAVKPGGYLIVQGFFNEATHENWQGFHQWDISLDDHGCMVILGKKSKTIIAWPPHKFATVNLLGRDWYYWIIKK